MVLEDHHLHRGLRLLAVRLMVMHLAGEKFSNRGSGEACIEIWAAPKHES